MTGRSCLKTILSRTEKDVNILWGEEIIFNIDKLECSEMIIEGLLLEKNELVVVTFNIIHQFWKKHDVILRITYMKWTFNMHESSISNSSVRVWKQTD